MAHSHPLSSTQLFRCATVATDSPDSHRVGSKMSKARTSREPSRSVPRHRGLTNSWGTKTVTDLEKEQLIKKKRCFWRNWFFEMFFICFVFRQGQWCVRTMGGWGAPCWKLHVYQCPSCRDWVFTQAQESTSTKCCHASIKKCPSEVIFVWMLGSPSVGYPRWKDICGSKKDEKTTFPRSD